MGKAPSSSSSRTAAPSASRPRRTGSQVPRIRVFPDGGAWTDGDDAAELCAHYWFTPDEWQRGLLVDWTTRRADGSLLVITAGLSVPRQNGKNGSVEALELYILLTDPSAHILHTAHQVKTAKRAFRRLSKVFESKRYPEIRRLVRDIRRTNGEEKIELWHPDHVGDPDWEGATIEYSARSRSSNRGFDKISHVIWDECQELTDAQVEAVMYTLGASETDRFMLYLGTPPGPTNPPDEVFTRTRRRALDKPSARMCWHEWSVESLPRQGASFADVVDAVYETNPGMGVRLDEDMTGEEFENSTLEGFARERLGWWRPEETSDPAIPADLWDAGAISGIGGAYGGLRALAVKFSPDGTAWALAGCKLAADRSRCAFELVELGSTSESLAPLAEALMRRVSTTSCVVIDGAAGASALTDRLKEAKAPKGFVVAATTGIVISAAQGLVDALADGTCAHTADPVTDAARRVATRRPIGTAGGWGFAGSIEMEACSLAVWGAWHTTRDPTRKQRLIS